MFPSFDGVGFLPLMVCAAGTLCCERVVGVGVVTHTTPREAPRNRQGKVDQAVPRQARQPGLWSFHLLWHRSQQRLRTKHCDGETAGRLQTCDSPREEMLDRQCLYCDLARYQSK